MKRCFRQSWLLFGSIAIIAVLLASPLLAANITSNRISGILWFDHNGNGVKESHEPGIAHANIYLQLVEDINDDDVGVIFVTASDNNGRYSFANLTEGEYNVWTDLDARPSRPSHVVISGLVTDTLILDFAVSSRISYLPLVVR